MNKYKRVLLINPPFTQPVSSKKRCMVPMGIAMIASFLRKHNVEVSILDCVVEGYHNDIIHGDKRTFGLSPECIKNRILSYNPDLIGVSCLMTSQKDNALRVCQIAKETIPSVKTVVGGAHPSACPEDMDHPCVDHIVVGEGEYAMLQIVKGSTDKILSWCGVDIEDMLEPARDLLPMDKYLKINMPENIFSPYDRVTQVVTSRGCPFRCSFCSTVRFHGKWRGRSSESVIQEIKQLKEKYDIQEINIVDENFVFDRDRVVKILSGIKDLNIAWSNPGGIWIDGLDKELLDLMKDSGCYQLTFPVETSNIDILKHVIHKPLTLDKVPGLVRHCHKIGIDVHAFFICGFPEQTRSDMLRDYEYAKRCRFDSASFNILTPFPGSPVYDKYKDCINVADANYIKSVIPHPIMSCVEIESLASKFNASFNKSYFWRHPIKWWKKYVGTARKKFGVSELPSLFRRV